MIREAKKLLFVNIHDEDVDVIPSTDSPFSQF